MNEIPRGPDLLAATRFVQAGRLTKATALLQRLLRGEPENFAGNTVDVVPSSKSGSLELVHWTLEGTAQRPEPPARKAVGSSVGNLPQEMAASSSGTTWVRNDCSSWAKPCSQIISG